MPLCNAMFFGGDPFEHFGGMPGGPGGRSGRTGSSAGNVDNEGYYKILGVGKDADENEIKKAYKKLALKHHPVSWPHFIHGNLTYKTYCCIGQRR